MFNYFPTKEDLVYQGMEAFETELLAAGLGSYGAKSATGSL